MQKIKQDEVLIHEVSGDYKDFRRDTLFIGLGTFGIIAVVGLIIQRDWLFAIAFGFCAMIAVLLDTFFTKQLFKFSFNDKEEKVRIFYTRFMRKSELEINYTELTYESSYEYLGKDEGGGQGLKIYVAGKLLLNINKKKYGWTDGLVQEVIKSLKFRKIKRKQ